MHACVERAPAPEGSARPRSTGSPLFGSPVLPLPGCPTIRDTCPGMTHHLGHPASAVVPHAVRAVSHLGKEGRDRGLIFKGCWGMCYKGWGLCFIGRCRQSKLSSSRCARPCRRPMRGCRGDASYLQSKGQGLLQRRFFFVRRTGCPGPGTHVHAVLTVFTCHPRLTPSPALGLHHALHFIAPPRPPLPAP